MKPIDKHKETFKEEAYELIGELETSLLELEESPDNAELVGRVFRAMHTIMDQAPCSALMILRNLRTRLRPSSTWCATEKYPLPKN